MFPKGVLAIVKESTLRTESADLRTESRESTCTLQNADRQLPRTKADQSKSSGADPRRSRSSSAELKEGIACLADDVSDLRQALEKLQEEVQQLQVKKSPLPDKVTEALLLDQVSTLAKEMEALKLEHKQALRQEVQIQKEDQIEQGSQNLDERCKEGILKTADKLQVSVPETLPSSAAVLKESKSDKFENEYYNLEGSIWDAAVLIGLPHTGFLGSVFIAILLFMNMLVQLVLCLMINDNFTKPRISRGHIMAMRRWRIFHAHSIDNMNKFSYQPFVFSICRSQSGMQMVTEAAELLSEINEYLPRQKDYRQADPFVGPWMPYFYGFGVLLSSICTMIWLLHVFKSLQQIIQKVVVFSLIPRGAKTEIVHGSDSRTLTCLTTVRKLLCMTVLVTQIIVVVLLGFSGTFYMIRTLHIRDLLLNCSALAIVLDVDELFFHAMVPHRAQQFMNMLNAPRPPARHFQGVGLGSLASTVFVVVILTCSCLELNRQASVLEGVRTEICGGNLNFVADEDNAGVIHAAWVDPSSQKRRRDNYVFEAMRQLVLSTGTEVIKAPLSEEVLSAPTAGVFGGPRSLIARTLPLFPAIESWNRRCADLLGDISNGGRHIHFLSILHDATGDKSISNCSQAKKYCNVEDIKGVRARQFCPVTCGCANAGSSLVIAGPNGCPRVCNQTRMFIDSMWSRECEDLGLDSPYWSLYGEGIKNFLGGSKGLESKQSIEANGCGLLTMQISFLGYVWRDPCELHDANLLPLTYACPASCQCRTHDRYRCPPTCRGPVAPTD